MRRYAIRVEPRAELEIDEEQRWWEQRNPSRAQAIADELEKAFRLLARLPGVGALMPVRRGWSDSVRYLVLDRIGYRLHYEVEEESRRVFVLSLWHEARRPPNVKARPRRH